MTDLTTISLGAGLQSSVLVEMVVEGELPPVDVVIFADTGDEPDYVYQQVEYLSERLETVGIPLDVVQSGNMVEDIYGGGRFASLPLFTVQHKDISGFGETAKVKQVGKLKRQCTSDYKVEPIEKHIRQTLLKEGKARQQKNGIYINKRVGVESWLGITLDEVERMKPNWAKFITNRWPLVEKRMTRIDCQLWLADRGLPVPRKSSCIRCPYHDDTYWRDMKSASLLEWRVVTDFDDDLRNGRIKLPVMLKGQLFLHKTCTPLRDVDFDKQNGQTAFAFCDEGYCWT